MSGSKIIRRILVIDDEVTHRILAKEYLEEAGYMVRLAEDGQRGLKMATIAKPDLILVDLMIPALDGYALCKALKSHEATADVPVIIVTASREPDVIERGIAAGADDFVTKPVDWMFLADRVGFVLGKSEENRRSIAEKQAMTRQYHCFQGHDESSTGSPASELRAATIASGEAAMSPLDGVEDKIRAVRESAEASLQGLELRHAAQMEALDAESQAMVGAVRDAAQRELEIERRRHAAEMDARRTAWEESMASVREAERAELLETCRLEAEATLHSALEKARAELDLVQQQEASKIMAVRAEAREQMRAMRESGLMELRAAEHEHTNRLEAIRAEGEAQRNEERQAAQTEVQVLNSELQRLRQEADQQVESVDRAVERQRLSAEMDCHDKIRSCWEIARVSSTAHINMVKLMLEKMRAAGDELGSAADLAPAKARLREIEKSAKTLSTSLGCVRMLAQTMSGKCTLDDTTFDLSRLLQDSAAKVETLADLHKVSVRTALPSGYFSVFADEPRIAYALLCLAMNAIRHSPHGACVYISLVDDNEDGVQIQVEDQGVGIAQPQLEALRNCLDRPGGLLFATGEKIGFGIPIATALTRLHGGRLESNSSLGRGTLVTMHLPASRRRSDALPAEDSDWPVLRAS